MNGVRNSPNKLKQTKITAFWSRGDKKPENAIAQPSRKRKNGGDISHVCKTPVKRVAKCGTPVENFENFEDFENDPFLSPKKKESPKKNVLTENLSGNVKSGINFEKPVKCKVTETSYLKDKRFELVLYLTDVTNGRAGVCKLREVWASSSVSPDDDVCIQAVFIDGDWVVNNKNGYLILHPDVLLSSTTLTRAMFCLRQGLLSKIFEEAPSESSNRMLIGRLIHELFQESLTTTTTTTTTGSDEELETIITRFMESRENLREFFFSGMNPNEIATEMKSFIPHVQKFQHVYLQNQPPTGKNFSIEKIVDIEEVVKSNTLGFQGRVDVTVNVKTQKGVKVAPLELKTGKASFSQEHRFQVILYILMMNELGRDVDSGLLLYLKEDILEEISPQRDDIRNMFLLRNRFVGFYNTLINGCLPEPVYNTKACARCSYLRVCTSYLGNEGEIFQGHPLHSLEIADLKPNHVDYFIRWSRMLCLEFDDVFREGQNEWEMSGLVLEPNITEFQEEFKCSFRISGGCKNGTFRCGTFVHVFDAKNNRKCSGQVLELTDSRVLVLTNTKLDDFAGLYKLTAVKSKFLYFYLTNLGWLLNEEYEGLRGVVVDKKPPGFDKNLNKTDFREKCLKDLLNLNKEQQKAVLKSLLCRDYLLIKGPPGTGKTQTIVALIKILLSLGKTVLVAGHTHSSIDNILLRLEGVEYLRLGSLKSIKKEVHHNCYGSLIAGCSSVDDVRRLFERRLIATTCMGIDADFVRRMKFDYCIVDESSQVLMPEILRPLFCTKKFILVGDEDQLRPIVRNPEARKLGMDTSLFERLSGDVTTVKLKRQYRMNSVINTLANGITYNGLLECGDEAVRNATMRISCTHHHQQDEWVVEVLSTDLEKSVVFVDTSECFHSGGVVPKQRSSLLEANIAVKLITSMVEFGLEQESIGVITPFWDQILLLTEKLTEKQLGKVEINTVDQFQGRDKDVIVFSCGKENQSSAEASELGLLNDDRRLTVAVTRAKHKLIILGDRETVGGYKPFEKLFKNMSESQFFCLSDGKMNFYWENFLK